jgi:hypothetical protein
MRSSHSLDRLDTAFDDDRLVADAGLKLPATLAQHLDLRELIEEHLDLGSATGAATGGDKVLRAGGPGSRRHRRVHRARRLGLLCPRGRRGLPGDEGALLDHGPHIEGTPQA